MKSKMLVLVIPPQVGLLRGFATGLLSLAAYIEQKMPDFPIKILDFSGLTVIEAESSIKQLSLPETTFMVGITTTTGSYQASLKVAGFFKKYFPACKVVFGGHHASNDPGIVLNHHSEVIDFIIIGEGEVALTALVSRYPSIESVPSLAYLDQDRRLVINEMAGFLTVQELDKISLSYHEEELYGSPGKFDAITYVSARGCPLKCAFCAVANEKMRSKSIGKVVEDISRLVKLGYQNIAIEDNFFAHSPKRTRELCTALKQLRRETGLEFSWDCQTRTESVLNPELVNLMEEAGCTAVYLGVEALDDQSLIYLKKTPSPEKYLDQLATKAVPNILDTNIECHINLQFGLPDQSNDQIEMTINMLRVLGDLATSKGRHLTIFPQLHVIYPGTEHFRQGVLKAQFGMDIFEHFTVWEEQQMNLYKWMGKSFAHGTGGIPVGILHKAKLRKNEFDLDDAQIQVIINTLQQIKQLAGIHIFEYNAYLN